MADSWSSQFANAKNVFGFADVAQRWKLVLTDVDALAREAPATDVCLNNNGFWRELAEVAIQISVEDPVSSENVVAGGRIELPTKGL